MSKSLKARCIRRWEVEFKGRCDSKFSMIWRKHHLRGYIRECALITADCMVDRLAYNNAMHDFFSENGDDSGWSPVFSAWYDNKRREKYLKEARDFLNDEVTTEEIDEEIQYELEAWND